MTKKIKKGFTLVELLFVMAIIAILAGFAIANLKDSTKVATENSVKNDVKNAIAQTQTFFAANQYYEYVDGDPDSQGIVDSDVGIKYTVSKGNHLNINDINCADGSDGFRVTVTNADVMNNNGYQYDSCSDGSIQYYYDD